MEYPYLDSSFRSRSNVLVPAWSVIMRCRSLVLNIGEIPLFLALEDLGIVVVHGAK